MFCDNVKMNIIKSNRLGLYWLILVTSLTLCSTHKLLKRIKRDDPGDEAAKMANQLAISAANVAKTAQDEQNPAGNKAAHMVKAELADKAKEAAKAARAVLIGKESFIQELTKEIEATQSVIQEETKSLRQLKNSANSVGKALEETGSLINNLNSLLECLRRTCSPYCNLNSALQTTNVSIRLAQENCSTLRSVLECLTRQIKDREKLLSEAKEQLEMLSGKLDASVSELKAVRESVRKADKAASQAKENAMKDDEDRR